MTFGFTSFRSVYGFVAPARLNTLVNSCSLAGQMSFASHTALFHPRCNRILSDKIYPSVIRFLLRKSHGQASSLANASSRRLLKWQGRAAYLALGKKQSKPIEKSMGASDSTLARS